MKCQAHVLINRKSALAKFFSANKMQKSTASLLKILFYVCAFSMVTAGVSQARDVALQWDPSADTSVTGYKVNYNADSASLPFSGTGAVQGVSPYDVQKVTTTTITGLDPARAYYFAITAYNSTGTESLYSNIVNVAEAAAPTVSITSPAANSTISGTVLVNATASDNVGVTKVEYYLNGILKTTDTASPYVYSLDTTSLASGTYTLMAKAYDAAGNVGQSSNVSVTVVNDTTAPTVSVTAPANNATIGGTTTVTASAADNVGVSKVEFYRSGVLLTATNVAPYLYSWNTTTVANGSYTLVAKAYDNSGNVAQSANVIVTVNNTVADTTAPSVAVITPSSNATVNGTVAVTASASDNVSVTKVEFYVNSALVATDTVSPFSYSWNTALVSNGTYSVAAKAYDAAGNVGQSASVTTSVNNQVVSVGSLWADTAAPLLADYGPDSAVELGVKFTSDITGYITGIRFYKAATNTGTHIGNLWTSTGIRLATATFTSETASGWQQVNFTTPVAIAANTVYVASYHTNSGHFSYDTNYFSTKGVDSAPLHALANGVSGYNSVYLYGTTSSFPNKGNTLSPNYWVDVAFSANSPADVTLPVVAITSPVGGATVSGTVYVASSASDNVAVTKVELYVNGALQATDTAAPYSFSLNSLDFANGAYTLTAKAYDAAGNVGQSSAVILTVNNDTTAPVVAITSPVGGATVSGTVYVASSASDNVAVTKVEFYVNGILQVSDAAAPYSFSWNSAAVVNAAYSLTAKAYDAAGNIGTSSAVIVAVANQAATYSVWSATTAPVVTDYGPDSAVELGVKFTSDVKGFITGVRFYKAATNTGTHIGSLWTSTGVRLATATFASESTSGWQQVNFATPVAIKANTVYVASYHTNTGHFSYDTNYFSTRGVDTAPLHALANGVSGANSVYVYGTTSTFPSKANALSPNYWVDVVFKP